MQLRYLNSKHLPASKRTTTTQGISTAHLNTQSGVQSPMRSTAYVNPGRTNSPIWLSELLVSEGPSHKPPVINARQMQSLIENAMRLGYHPHQLRQYALLNQQPRLLTDENLYAANVQQNLDLMMDIQKLPINQQEAVAPVNFDKKRARKKYPVAQGSVGSN